MYQIFYLARDKSKELSVVVTASGFEEAKKFFADKFEGLELTRIKELQCAEATGS